mmetsp:Transcript_39862/g.124622  ORF Transcript_39862/g.124622 Transcript_39862/m.124622 type:complete len:336 (-) Transcript_39862:284-1291(-)
MELRRHLVRARGGVPALRREHHGGALPQDPVGRVQLPELVQPAAALAHRQDPRARPEGAHPPRGHHDAPVVHQGGRAAPGARHLHRLQGGGVGEHRPHRHGGGRRARRAGRAGGPQGEHAARGHAAAHAERERARLPLHVKPEPAGPAREDRGGRGEPRAREPGRGRHRRRGGAGRHRHQGEGDEDDVQGPDRPRGARERGGRGSGQMCHRDPTWAGRHHGVLPDLRGPHELVLENTRRHGRRGGEGGDPVRAVAQGDSHDPLRGPERRQDGERLEHRSRAPPFLVKGNSVEGGCRTKRIRVRMHVRRRGSASERGALCHRGEGFAWDPTFWHKE